MPSRSNSATVRATCGAAPKPAPASTINGTSIARRTLSAASRVSVNVASG